MNKTTILILFTCLTFHVSSFAEKKLKFLTLDYCPLICKTGQQRGILADFLHEIYGPLGYKIDITFMPIKRAFVEYKNGLYDGFIGGNKAQLSENLFPEYVTSPHSPIFYKLKTNPWQYKNIDSLNNVRIAAVGTYKHANAEVDNYLQSKKKNVVLIGEKNHVKRYINLLRKGRVDSFIGGEFPTEYYLKEYKLSDEIVPASKDIGVFNNYISISPKSKRAEKLLSQLNSQFIKLYKSGALQKIYSRYGVRRKVSLVKAGK